MRGDNLSVDGSFVEANAAKESRIPREQLAEAAQVKQTLRQYLAELEEQNPVEEPVHEQEQVSTTDPDSTYATKGGTPARLGYYDNYLVDNASCVIVGVQGTAARMSQETVAAQDMLTRFAQWQGREAGIDGGRCHLRQWRVSAMVNGAGASLPTCEPATVSTERTARSTARSSLLISRKATAIAAPQGSNSTTAVGVIATAPISTSEPANVVGACSQRPHCTSAAFRCLAIHMHEPARQRARELANTPEFAKAQRQRKKVEALFAELKNQIGLRRLRLRRLKFVREQFFLAAAAQNIKRLVRFLSKAPSPTLAATA